MVVTVYFKPVYCNHVTDAVTDALINLKFVNSFLTVINYCSFKIYDGCAPAYSMSCCFFIHRNMPENLRLMVKR
jgi:hypothetical protein